VGEGVIRSLVAAGARVIATGRAQSKLDGLAERVDSDLLRVATIDALAPDLDESVAALAAEAGPFDAVIVSIASWGGQGSKPLLNTTDDEWNLLIEGNLTAVFRIYRAFLPELAPGGLLLQLNGMSADIPFPGNAGVAIGAAATKSMTRTAAVELAPTGLRVYEVLLGVVRTRERQLAGIDNPRWIDGEEIGIHIAELVAGTSPLRGEVVHYFVDKATGPHTSAPQFR
jgi:NAD(P)-dependent dehydrogenase (short-subunit alcohol dehydrogenase family)